MRRSVAVLREHWCWFAYLGAGALGIGAYFLLPEHGAGAYARLVIYLLISSSAAAAVWWGSARHRPAARLPWLLFGLSQVVYAAGDAVFYISHDVLHSA